MRKKFISLILGLAMLFSCIPNIATAEQTATLNTSDILDSGICGMNSTDDGKLKWSLTYEGVLTISGEASMQSTPWDSYKDIITSVVIEDCAKNITISAFEYCTNLVSVSMTDSVTRISDGAFMGCSALTSVNISGTIGTDVFCDCTSLTEVTISDNVTSIGSDAFNGCTSLTSINIPSGVESIGSCVFGNCGSLYITVDEDNENYSSVDGVLFNKDKTTLVSYSKDVIEPDYEVPDGVTAIDDSAFRRCKSLTSVTIPTSVTIIDYEAFYGCDSLTDVYYMGTEEEWNSITIEDENDSLTSATIHCLGTSSDEPTATPTVTPTVAPTVAPTVTPTIEPTTEPVDFILHTAIGSPTVDGNTCTAEIYFMADEDYDSEENDYTDYVIFAAYNKKGALVGMTTKTVDLYLDHLSYQMETLSCTVSATPSYVKCFVWKDSLGTMTPIADIAEAEI